MSPLSFVYTIQQKAIVFSGLTRYCNLQSNELDYHLADSSTGKMPKPFFLIFASHILQYNQPIMYQLKIELIKIIYFGAYV